MNIENWLSAGYKRFEISGSREANRLADFLLQRAITDEVGRKYFITVYCYDNKKLPLSVVKLKIGEYSFMPTSHFSLGDNRPFFSIDMNAPTSIEEVEEYFEKFWVVLGQPYYDKHY